MKKILIIDLDNVGDVALTSFLPRALKKIYPDSSIGFLVKEYSLGVIENNPFIDEIIVFNPPWSRDMLNKRNSWRETARILSRIKEMKFAQAIIVNADWRKAAVAFAAGVPQRIGENKKKAALFLTRVIPYHDDLQKHRVEYNLDLLKTVGWAAGEINPVLAANNEIKLEIFISRHSRDWAQEFLLANHVPDKSVLIAIHPGAGHPARIWPTENYLALIALLLKTENVYVLVFGGERDKNAQEIVQKTHSSRVIEVKNVSVQQMAALFQKCSAVVAQDSGPMHVAVVSGVRVAAIFGPSNDKRFGPYGREHIVVKNELECSPCGSDPHCANRECLDSIDAEQVLAAVEEIVESRGKNHD